MKRISLFLTLAGLCTTLLTALPARASTHQAEHATPAKTATNLQTVKLGPIVVKGLRLHALPLPVKLQMVKAALKRPANLRQENLSKLVCRFDKQGQRDAMSVPLHCETNCDILRSLEGSVGSYISCDIGESAMLNERIAASINSHYINRGTVMAFLKKLPPPDSSYTFQVKSHGKVVARWVIESGQVVKVEVQKQGDQ